MVFDAREQRRIMGRFATGVTVVTTSTEDGNGWGMTANAVTSLSLNPPLVLVAVDCKGKTHGLLKAAGCFAVNILSSSQEALSNRFATDGPKDFSDLNIRTAETGSPILPDTLGFVDCKLVDVLPGGDHDLFIGEILAGDSVEAGAPLLYYSGKYAEIAPPKS